MISTAKQEALRRRMTELGLREEDLVEKFIAGSGPGGQKINKTANCVYLRHFPTGIEIQCQENRSRPMNRYLARVRLCDRFEEHREQQKLQSARRRALERYRKRRRSAAEKRRARKHKERRAEKKRFRKKPSAGRDD